MHWQLQITASVQNLPDGAGGDAWEDLIGVFVAPRFVRFFVGDDEGRAIRGRVARVRAPARATSKPGLLSFNVAGLGTLVQVLGYVRVHLHTAEIQFVTKMLSKRLG